MVAAVRSLCRRKWRGMEVSVMIAREALMAPFCTHQQEGAPAPPRLQDHPRVLRSLGKQSSLFSHFTRDATSVRRIIEERCWDAKMEESLGSSSIPFCEGLVVEIIKSLSEAKLALRFFIWMAQQAHMQHFCRSASVVDVLSRRWSHEKQLNLFLRTLRLDPQSMTPHSFYVLLMGYGWAGMIDKAAETLESMDSVGIPIDSYHFLCVLNVIEQEKCFHVLPRVRKKMQQVGFYPGVEMYNKLVWGLCIAGQKEEALNLFEEMKSRGLSPAVETYRILISMFSKANEALKVLNIFNELLRDGVEPDAKAFNALIKAFSLAGKLHEALEVLNQMLEKSLNPNLVSLTMVADGLFASGEIDEVLGLWSKLNKKSIPTVTFQDRLVSELHKVGRQAEVEKVLAGQTVKDSKT